MKDIGVQTELMLDDISCIRVNCFSVPRAQETNLIGTVLEIREL